MLCLAAVWVKPFTYWCPCIVLLQSMWGTSLMIRHGIWQSKLSQIETLECGDLYKSDNLHKAVDTNKSHVPIAISNKFKKLTTCHTSTWQEFRWLRYVTDIKARLVTLTWRQSDFPEGRHDTLRRPRLCRIFRSHSKDNLSDQYLITVDDHATGLLKSPSRS